MKLLIITEYFPKSSDLEVRGGVETRCFYIAKELAKRHDVTVISALEPEIPKEQIIEGVKIIRCGKPKEYLQTGGIIQRLGFMKEVYTIGCKLDIDLVEGTNFITYLPAYYITKKKEIPSIAWYNDVWIGKWVRNIGLISGLAGEILERFALSRNWSYIMANSNFTLNNLIKQGKQKNKLKVIPCGIDLKKCNSIKVKKEGMPSVCCVSRLVSYKRIDVLIKALSYIKSEIPSIKCRIVGTGPEKKRLKRLVEDLDLEENVDFLGFIKSHQDVLRKIKSSHILCLPSVVEGFGIVVLEATACSTPYVCSNIPALKEVTNNAVGGLLFERENPRDLSKKILYLLKDDNLYNKCSKEGLKLVRKYDWKNIAQKTERLYEWVIKQPLSFQGMGDYPL